VSLARRLDLPDDTPRAVVFAAASYLLHILCSGWVASSESFAFFAILGVLWSVHRKLLAPHFHILYFPLFVYCLDSTFSALVAPRRLHAGGEIALWGKAMLFPAAYILLRNLPSLQTLAIRALLVFGAFSAGFGFVQYLALGQHDLEHRITGPTAHVMTLSGLLLPVSLLFMVLLLHDARNPWLLAGSAATTLALFLTLTRSAWIGWFVAVLVILLLRRPRVLLWAAPAAVLLIALMPLSFFARMASSFDTRQESNLDRIRMFEAGVEIIKDYPLLGVGPANVKETYPLYRRHDAPRFRVPHLHNNFVQLWAERGVLGLAAYVLLIGLFLRECWRGLKTDAAPYAEAGLAVTVALVVAGFFEFNFGDTEVFWMLLEVMAIVAAAVARAEPLNELGAPAVAGGGP
jgi:O-antigen ligase